MTPDEQALVREVVDLLVSQVPRDMSTKMGPVTFRPSPRGPLYAIVHVQHVKAHPVGFIIEEQVYEINVGARRLVGLSKPQPG